MISNNDLIVLVADSLEIEKSDIDAETRLDSIEEFDSLGALSVFTAISQKTNGKSDDIDLTEAETINEIFIKLKDNGLAS